MSLHIFSKTRWNATIISKWSWCLGALGYIAPNHIWGHLEMHNSSHIRDPISLKKNSTTPENLGTSLSQLVTLFVRMSANAHRDSQQVTGLMEEEDVPHGISGIHDQFKRYCYRHWEWRYLQSGGLPDDEFHASASRQPVVALHSVGNQIRLPSSPLSNECIWSCQWSCYHMAHATNHRLTWSRGSR